MVFYQDAGLQRTIRAQVDFFLVNLPGLRRRPHALDTRLAELTAFFSVFSFHMPLADITRAPSIDAALAAATKDFCLIQNSGHMFYGYDQLSYAMKAELDACDFVTGRIDGAGRLDPACLLVNRRRWEELGRPPFDGTAGAAGLHPRSWNPELARAMWTCNPDGDAGSDPASDLFEWMAALEDVPIAASADPALAATLSFLNNLPDRADAPKKVFVFNSETDADLPQLRYRPGIDTAFVLASGFKANRILEQTGFHEGTKVVVYDYSAPALIMRRMMVEEWDGEDFGGFFARLRPRLVSRFAGSARFVPAPLLKDPAAVNAEFQREVAAVFPTPEAWRTHWQRFRQLAHAYVEADVINDRSAAKAMIAAHARGHAVLWISDMFNSPNAVGKYGWERRRAAYDVIADALKVHAASDLILGGAPALWLRR